MWPLISPASWAFSSRIFFLMSECPVGDMMAMPPSFSTPSKRVLEHLTSPMTVSYTHLRAHETRHDLVCRLLLEKKKKKKKKNQKNQTKQKKKKNQKKYTEKK